MNEPVEYVIHFEWSVVEYELNNWRQEYIGVEQQKSVYLMQLSLNGEREPEEC